MTESARRPDGARILIVDDDSVLLRLLARALADYGVVTAQDGVEALALLDSYDPALLITDYLMPEMTGTELIARARKHKPSLKALMLTGHGDLLQNEPWWTEERHLPKPCSTYELRKAVSDLIGAAPRHRAA